MLSDSSSPNVLKIEVLRFVSLAFSEGSAAELMQHLAELAPCLKRSLQDRYYKVVAEAVAVVERSAVAGASVGGTEHGTLFRELFKAVLELLKAKDVDQEVKECSIRCACYCPLIRPSHKCCARYIGVSVAAVLTQQCVEVSTSVHCAGVQL